MVLGAMRNRYRLGRGSESACCALHGDLGRMRPDTDFGPVRIGKPPALSPETGETLFLAERSWH
jgi:hypothetical protein